MTKINIQVKRLDYRLALINGKRVRLHGHGGIRPKCFYGNYVIKFDDDGHINTADEEVRIWESIKPRHKKYFAKLVGWDIAAGYVIQERVKFRRGRRPTHAKNIVRDMVREYDIEDVFSNDKYGNWSMSELGLPMIFDFAASY